MGPTGVFFIPAIASTSPDNPLSSTIFSHFTALHHPDPLPRWNLEHRLYRETAVPVTSVSQAEQSKLPTVRYLQILSLSHHPGRSHVATTAIKTTSAGGSEMVADPATIASIPAPPGCDEFVQLISTRLLPLWTPRHVLQVINGQAYEIGDFAIRFGEVKQGQGGSQQIRGTIVEIEWRAGDTDDWETAEQVIRAFWAQVDIEGAKEFINVPGVDQGSANARQWFEAMRLRG